MRSNFARQNVTFVPLPRAIQYVKNHKCTVLTINIFQEFLCRIDCLQIIESTMLSISHTAEILKVEQ